MTELEKTRGELKKTRMLLRAYYNLLSKNCKPTQHNLGEFLSELERLEKVAKKFLGVS